MARLKAESAFPNNHGVPGRKSVGMSLRDYFAARSMQATISKVVVAATHGCEPMSVRFTEKQLQERYDSIAESAYAMADAMLRERAK